MTLRPAIAGWLGARSPRERRLLAAAGAAVAALVVLGLGQAARDDVATLRALVAGHERELAEVRRLAAALGRHAPRSAATDDDATSLLGRLEATAAGTVGRERVAAMTPATGDAVALRVTGASLADVVRLLHGLATAAPPLAVTRLEMRKHPDDPARFDATVEVAR